MRKFRLLSIILILLLLPVQVFAAGMIDETMPVTMTISCYDGETPLAGVAYDIFLVATVDAHGELTVTEEFSAFNVNIRGKNDDAWEELARTLEGYVLLNALTPAHSGVTDAEGKLTFSGENPTIVRGLYLVMGCRHSQNGYIYEQLPFMVLLPGRDSRTDEWHYNVTVSCKLESKEEEITYIDLTVLKAWEKDREAVRPEEIKVFLLCDGKVYDEVMLSKGNSWRWEWKQLEENHSWTVVEAPVHGYQAALTQEGNKFLLTNTYINEVPDDPDNPDLPQTGQLWWPVPVLTALGMLLMVVGLIRRRGEEYDA